MSYLFTVLFDPILRFLLPYDDREAHHGTDRQAAESDQDSERAASHAADVATYYAGPSYSAFTSADLISPAPYDVARDQSDVEEVDEDLPILAKKVARLALADGRPALEAPYKHEPIDIGPVEARCWRRLAHQAPDLDCECGFYAIALHQSVNDDAGGGTGYVTLLVQLSGTVIEHERGYRAQCQRVVEVETGPCVHCSAPPTEVGRVTQYEWLTPLCGSCAPGAQDRFTLENLETLLGVRVVP